MKTAHTSNEDTVTSKKRKKSLIIATIIFVVIFIAYLVYWAVVLRFQESTDDAYVSGNKIQVMSQITGTVIGINSDDTELVHAGDVLVTLDPTDAEQNYQKSLTALAETVRKVQQLMINSKQYKANIELQQINLTKLKKDLARRETLSAKKVISPEELQHAQDAVKSAQASLVIAQQQYNANQAAILNTPIPEQPSVKEAAATVRQAWLTLQRTKIVSPITGYVSKRSVQVGQTVSPSTPLMAIVPNTNMWVEANFKENQLADIRIGQPVTMSSDVYGSSYTYHGKIIGLAMGTGSAFSLLPAQNATGNWIKVVQRVPVKISLNPSELASHPLRVGLSMTVEVNTHNRSGSALATKSNSQTLYQTTALTPNLTPINAIINKVIQNNTDNSTNEGK